MNHKPIPPTTMCITTISQAPKLNSGTPWGIRQQSHFLGAEVMGVLGMDSQGLQCSPLFSYLRNTWLGKSFNLRTM